MTRLLLLLLPLLGFASEIKVDHTQVKPLGKIIQTNAKITQLSNQKQKIVSRLTGHLESYFVKAGEEVKSGEKVALIESIELSKMTAEYLALIQQERAAQIQKDASEKLHQKGLSSQNDLSNAIIALEEIRSKQNALASQLTSLGIDPAKLQEATDKLYIYAHADGVVGKILAPLHSNVDAQTILMTLVNQSGYYAVAYLAHTDAMKVNKETKGWVKIGNESYPAHFVQLLPTIDTETQRAKVLFELEKHPKNLLLDAYTEMEISLPPSQEFVMVQKSALTLFNGEWVVFAPKVHEEEADHKQDHQEHEAHHHDEDEHERHSMEKAENHAPHDEREDAHEHAQERQGEHHENHAHQHDEDEHEVDSMKEAKNHAAHDGHEDTDNHIHKEDSHDAHGHGTHKEEEIPYEPHVVEIIAYAGDEVAIRGLQAGMPYVSEGVYFIKSMLLKSALGEHGH